MSADCVFCKIANREMNSEMLFENDHLMVIKDILPKAPVHVLVIPKRHVVSINDLTEGDGDMIGELILTAKEQAKNLGIFDSGYKLVVNVGHDGGQVVPHLHLHVLGGKKFQE